MADLVDDTRALAMTAEGDEDFGYVHRDSNLLKKALAGQSGGSDNASGDTGSDVKRKTTDVVLGTSAAGVAAAGAVAATTTTTRSVDNGNPGAEEVRVNVFSFEDSSDASPKKGILKSVDSESAGNYDDNKRSASVTSTTTSTDQLGPLKLSSQKSSVTSTNSEDQLSDLPKLPSKKSSTAMKKMTTPSKTLSAGPIKEDLPQMFQVKYLGHQDARGLWGIKHTRRPVDNMVTAAKNLRVGVVLPMVKLVVTKDGVVVLPAAAKSLDDEPRTVYGIDTISYGVQDLVYTRVFSMIVVKDSGANAKEVHPFECHAYVCESRHSARRLTYSLAAAFQEYSKAVNASGAGGAAGAADNKEKVARIKKRFAIDLRSPDEIEADLEEETEA